MMTMHTVGRVERQDKVNGPSRRVIAVGKRQNGRWKVRTSLWRYLAETAVGRS